jgi:hypothetical protein
VLTYFILLFQLLATLMRFHISSPQALPSKAYLNSFTHHNPLICLNPRSWAHSQRVLEGAWPAQCMAASCWYFCWYLTSPLVSQRWTESQAWSCWLEAQHRPDPPRSFSTILFDPVVEVSADQLSFWTIMGTLAALPLQQHRRLTRA